MGVPQRRERVFFIAHRNDLNFPKLQLSFNEPPILFKEIRSEKGVELEDDSVTKMRLMARRPTDKKIADILGRNNENPSNFGTSIINDNDVAQTLVSGGMSIRMVDGMKLSTEDIIHIQTFPEDYDFQNQQPKYICGMSVPPVMMAQVSSQVYEQWLRRLK
jgi:DNA (cytosine-5)-methyltransferase 1